MGGCRESAPDLEVSDRRKGKDPTWEKLKISEESQLQLVATWSVHDWVEVAEGSQAALYLPKACPTAEFRDSQGPR